jgi:hypothetical protein
MPRFAEGAAQSIRISVSHLLARKWICAERAASPSSSWQAVQRNRRHEIVDDFLRIRMRPGATQLIDDRARRRRHGQQLEPHRCGPDCS